MDQILKFPDPLQKAARRGADFQRLSPDRRIKDIIDTIECGLLMIRQSPIRSNIDRMFLERERNSQLAHREIFLRHGR